MEARGKVLPPTVAVFDWASFKERIFGEELTIHLAKAVREVRDEIKK
jgi:hypothetical protein